MWKKKEVEAFSKCELDGKIVKDFDFKIEEIKQNFPCKFIGLAQRDERWKNDKLGSSIYTVGDFGIGMTPNSKLSISGLPTSATGLSTGDVWNNSGVLTII